MGGLTCAQKQINKRLKGEIPSRQLDTGRAERLPERVNCANRCYPEKEMIRIYSPNDELELSMIRGVFDAEGIHYFVHNDYFGSMRVGPQIDLLNKKTIMVAPEEVDRAKEVISNFLERRLPEEEEQGHEQYSIGQKLRMILETIFFCWFIPERKRSKKRPEE